MNTEPSLAWRTEGDLHWLTDPGAAERGLRLAFTTRLGGVSSAPYDSLNLSAMVGDADDDVAANRALAATVVGVDLASVALPRQVHGPRVAEVHSGSREPVPGCDGLVTVSRTTTVGVLAADCVPILMTDGRSVAAVHAGWRGLVSGVIGNAADRLDRVRAAWVGPSIRACCYEVGNEVIEAFQEAELPVASADRVDPGEAAVASLRKVGVDAVASSTECTSCDERFFSHRRDGTTGRQGAFIGWL